METRLDKLRQEARERLAKLANKSQQQELTPTLSGEPIEYDNELVNSKTTIEQALINKYGFNPYVMDNGLILNDRQREAVDKFGLQGLSGCLIGPAGTGKTTTMKAVIRAAVMCGRIPIIDSHEEHKFIPTGGPGIWGGSFTRIATRNLRDNFPDDLKSHVHTIHRLLEFQPTKKEVEDGKGGTKTIRIFMPNRDIANPLPSSYMMFNFDEGSMVGCELHNKWEKALGNKKAQALYIGDIAQLPPVMDDSILGYKLLDLPVVELTEVYRHAGIIVALANHIRVGKTIPSGREVIPFLTKPSKIPRKIIDVAIQEWNKEEDGSKVTIHLWKNRLEGEVGQLQALQTLGLHFFPKEIKAGNYDPLNHMILMPYNKAVGTIELNNYLANYLGKERGATVHEVICGYDKKYLAEGDKVFYDREEAIITKIVRNGTYSGKVPQKSAVTLDRWGHNQAGQEESGSDMDMDHFSSIDNIMLQINTEVDDEERKNQASHVIYVKKLIDLKEETPENKAQEYSLNTAAEINNLLYGYALTIHKAQGSQWQKVYCIFHNSHNRNLQRELLYTAITRAQKELYVICEPETFIQGVLSQHITGNTLAQKAEYFKGKQAANNLKKDLFTKQDKEEG